MEGDEFLLLSSEEKEEISSSQNELTNVEVDITEDDIETMELIQLLKQEYGQFESKERNGLRKEVLSALRQIWNKWVKDVAIIEKKDSLTISNARWKIFTFGSYRLGVHCPNTDIDTLCVWPRFVDRK